MVRNTTNLGVGKLFKEMKMWKGGGERLEKEKICEELKIAL